MLEVFVDVILPVFLVAGVGGAIGRRIGLDADPFSSAVFWIFSPALVFTSMVEIDVPGSDLVRIGLLNLGIFVANVAIAAGWARLRHSDAATAAVVMLAASVPNQGNLGLPVSRLAFGDDGLSVAVVVWVVGVVLASSLGVAVGSLGHFPLRRALIAPFRYPSIYAAVAGAVVNASNVDLPLVVSESVGTVAAGSIPVMLLVLGLQLHVPPLRDVSDALASTVNRLLIGPALAWPGATALGLRGATRGTVTILAAMPTAVMVTVLARQLGGRADVAVRAVVVSTLACLATLTVLITLVK